MNESILPGIVYHLGKRKGKPKIKREIISTKLKAVSVDKYGVPINIDAMPVYELRISNDKIGNPFHRRLIVNESDDSKKAIEIMESFNVCYSIIWLVGEKDILFEGSIEEPIPRVPLPSLYLSDNIWLHGVKNIKYHIRLIKSATPDVLRSRDIGKDNGLIRAGWLVYLDC